MHKQLEAESDESVGAWSVVWQGFGIHTIRDLAKVNLPKMKARFGIIGEQILTGTAEI